MKPLLTLFLLSICIFAHAHENAPEVSPFSAQYYACIKKAGPPGFYDQSAGAQCDDAEVRFQKKRINIAYGKIVKTWSSNPQEIAKLNNAQKLWVQWRDNTYELLQDIGGTNGQVVYIVSSQFLLQSLVDQANLLEGILTSNGGG